MWNCGFVVKEVLFLCALLSLFTLPHAFKQSLCCGTHLLASITALSFFLFNYLCMYDLQLYSFTLYIKFVKHH